MQYLLLGFDIRVTPGTSAKEGWDMSRRSLYLLQESIETPLSVDSAVWPSVDKYYHPIDESKQIIGSESVAPQEITHVYKNIDEATANLSLMKAQQLNGIVIAIEVLSDQMLDTEYWHLLSEPAVPDKLPECWKIIGHDIADESFISGLSNCGYTKDEKLALKNIWGNRLNQYGLFTSLDDAVQFCNLTNDRVPEHKPFRIYRISHSPYQSL